MKKIFLFFLSVSVAFISVAMAGWCIAQEITVVGASSSPGDTTSIDVVASNPGDIAGVVCTLVYNTDYFTLINVESVFFDTFSNQWAAMNPVPDPLPPTEINVDNVQYDQPIISHVDTGKVMLAGIRLKATQEGNTLFTLNFHVSDQVPDGIYPVSITPTTIYNSAAGYADGSAIPVLVGLIEGETDPELAFPVLNSTLVNGVITINTVITDTDGDGIDDAWEMRYFGNLITADQTSDYDKDGYSDLQEFLNQSANELDPLSNPYDPTVPNAPGGTGYTGYGSSNFWIMILPAILGNSSP